MATAEELLSGVLKGTDDSITVDSDFRKIIIPDSIRNIGVESDEEVLELKFSLPRYYGRFDLSEFKPWINYLTAEGEPDVHEVKDILVDEDTIAFIWEVGRHTTSYRGDVVFALTLRKYFGHIILKEFNTTVATLPVLEGLQTGEAVVHNHADLLEQWRIELFGLADSKVQVIENAGDVELAAIAEAGAESVDNVKAVETNILGTLEEQRLQSIDDVHQKGVEVLASIPEDYTTMNNQVGMLTRFAGPVIRQEASGEIVAVSDSSRNPLLGLNVYGKSEQATTKGYQIFDANRFNTYTNGGITLTNNGDGSLTLSNTGASTVYFNTGFSMSHEETIAMLKAGVLRLKTEKTTYPYISVQVKGDGVVYAEITNLTSTNSRNVITEDMLNDESLFIHCCFFGMADQTFEGGTVRPMLYMEGDCDGTWEPFTGGKPGPNIDYPLAIKNLGEDSELTAGILGNNIIDPKSLILSSNKSLEVSDDGYTITVTGGTDHGWTSSIYEVPTELVKLLRGKKIYSTCDSYSTSQENTGTRAGFNVTLEDGTTVYPASIGVVNTRVAETINKKAVKIVFGIYTNNSGVALKTDNVVTIKGLRVSIGDYVDWEEHKKFQPMIIPRIVRAIPVTDVPIANYTNKNGQQYVCDEIDEARSVHIQRINTLALTPTFVLNESTNEMWIQLPTGKEAYADVDTSELVTMCTHFPGDSRSNVYNNSFAEGYRGICVRDRYVRIVDNVNFNGDPDALNAWIQERTNAGDKILVSYILAKPIETPLTAEEIQAFKALHTNYPNTTILNDSGAYMKVAYAADTKTYIDNKFAELQATITGES